MNVDDVVAEKITAARARAEAAKARRAALNAARQRGLAHRHAQRLRNQASRGDTPTVTGPTVAQTVTVDDPDRVDIGTVADLHYPDGHADVSQTHTTEENQ